MVFQDHYAILSLRVGASAKEIARARKRLASRLHPDTFPNDPEGQAWANECLKQINEAYAVLSDPTKRSEYDRTYAERKTAHERSHQEQRQQHREREQYREPRVPCPTCGRQGRIPCPVCEGYGDRDCPGCQGQRSIVCPLCLGVGTLTEAKYREHVAEEQRAREQARAQAARQEAEVAARRRTEQDRDTRRQVAMAGAGVLLLLLVARSCAADSRPPVASSTRQASAVVQPTPYRPPVQPTPRPPQPSARISRPPLRSIHSQVPTQVTFRNETRTPVRVLWIDYQGREVPYRQLYPGESYVQPTFATHPWRVRETASGKVLRTVVAGVAPMTVVIPSSVPQRPSRVVPKIPPPPPLEPPPGIPGPPP